MNEQNKNIRPTKKQRDLLVFIESFIGEHGYSPSYREIMRGLNYTSVATVSLHVNSLIQRGHLVKRDYSARSLELVAPTERKVRTNAIKASEEKWLVEKIDYYFAQAETTAVVAQHELDALYVLIGALKVLGLDSAAQSFMPRLAPLRDKIAPPVAH